MRPIKMSKIGLLAAAMYEILETKRNHSLVAFSVLVDTTQTGSASASDEYIVFGKVISGHIQLDGQGTIREFKVYINTYGNLAVRVTRAKTHYTGDTTRVEIHGNVEIDFRNKSIVCIEEHEFGKEHELNWSWQAVKGTALDIIGSILGKQNPF